MTDEPISFEERLAQARAKLEAKKLASTPEPSATPTAESHDFGDDVPVLGRDDSAFQEERLELDGLMSQIDILDAYARWCGKMTPKVGGKRENIMISCPNPGHADKKPSAWVNLDKQAWYCGSCSEGGDKFDIAATKFGIDYRHNPEEFVKLKKEMASEYGYVVKQDLSGRSYVEEKQVWVEPEPETQTNSAPPVPTQLAVAPDIASTSSPTEVAESDQSATVIQLPRADTEPPPLDLENLGYPILDWKAVIAPDSFLDEWMSVYIKDDLPEEYYFFHGLTAIGAACGRSVSFEMGNSITGNLLTCLIGNTASGKSRSTSALIKLLNQALPYDYNNPMNQGIKHVPMPGSGEHLLRQFSAPIEDPADPKKILGHASVKGLVDFDEFSNLTTRGARAGSTLQQTLMRLYDGYVPRTGMGSITHGTAVVENPFMMGTATTQPSSIQTLVSTFDKSSGFLNRWFFVTGTPKEPIPIQKNKFDQTESIKKLQQIRSWSGLNRVLNFTSEGEIAYKEFYKRRIAAIKKGTDATEGLLGRLDLAGLKLMLILCANEHKTEVDADIIGKAEIILQYLERTFLYVNGFIGIHEDVPIQEAIVDTIEAHVKKYNGRPIKANELMKNYRINRKFSSYRIERTIKSMLAMGFMEEIEMKGARGPGTRGFKLASSDK